MAVGVNSVVEVVPTVFSEDPYFKYTEENVVPQSVETSIWKESTYEVEYCW